MVTKMPKQIRVLVVSKCPITRLGLDDLIKSQKPKMKLVQMFSDYNDMPSSLESLSPDVILLDLDLRMGSGLDIITKIKGMSTAKVLVLTGLGDVSLHKKIENLAAVAEIVDKSDAVESIIDAIKKSRKKKSSPVSLMQPRFLLVSGGSSSHAR